MLPFPIPLKVIVSMGEVIVDIYSIHTQKQAGLYAVATCMLVARPWGHGCLFAKCPMRESPDHSTPVPVGYM